MGRAILEMQTELAQIVGSVRVKKLFTGYGFFAENSMFAIMCNHNFYVRAQGKLANFLLAKGAINWSEDCKMKLAINHYYLISDKLKADDKLYRRILISSIKQANKQKLKLIMKNTGRIKYALNLSIKHERLLKKVGINSSEELFDIGAEVAYARLKKTFPKRISMKIYWDLLSAVERKLIELFTKSEKIRALTRLNKVLKNMGLKEVNIDKYVQD